MIKNNIKPRVATLSPSTSSGVMWSLWVRSSSSVTGLLSTWLLRDLSRFKTPPPGLRSRAAAAVLWPPPPLPETSSATGASLRASAPLIAKTLSLAEGRRSDPRFPTHLGQTLQKDGVVDVECGDKCRRNSEALVFVNTCCTVTMTTTCARGEAPEDVFLKRPAEGDTKTSVLLTWIEKRSQFHLLYLFNRF